MRNFRYTNLRATAALWFALIFTDAASAAAQVPPAVAPPAVAPPAVAPPAVAPAPLPAPPAAPPPPPPPPPAPPAALSLSLPSPAPTGDEVPPRVRYPISLVERPITLPMSTVSVTSAFFGGRSAPLLGAPYGWLASSLGAAFGITDNLTVGAMPFGISYVPILHYNNPSVGFDYQIARELGLSGGVTFLQAN